MLRNSATGLVLIQAAIDLWLIEYPRRSYNVPYAPTSTLLIVHLALHTLSGNSDPPLGPVIGVLASVLEDPVVPPR
jgi:hypothetical protein